MAARAGADLHGWPLGAQLRTLTVGPVERPSSSPRPDIGEVYADGVLLVWKPVESYGPVTYIVQCSLEGRPAPVPSPPGWTQEAPGPSASPAPLGEVLALSSFLGSLPQEWISPPHPHLLTVEW